MKKILLVLSMVALCLIIVACAPKEEVKKEEPSQTEESTVVTDKEESEVEIVPEQNMKVSLKNFDITIAGAELTEREGEPMLRVFYDYTNTSDEILCALFGIQTQRTATQKGEELDGNIHRLDDVEEYEYYSAYSMQGVIVRAAENFTLLDTSSPVTLLLEDRQSSEELTVEFDLANLPKPGPAPELVPIKEVDIESMEGYAGTESDFQLVHMGAWIHLKIVESEIVEKDGKTVARVVLEFTALEAEKEDFLKPFQNMGSIFFQDGLTLESAYSLPKREGVVPSVTEVGIGETVLIEETILLRSDSPVIACISSYDSAPTEGAPFIGVVLKK